MNDRSAQQRAASVVTSGDGYTVLSGGAMPGVPAMRSVRGPSILALSEIGEGQFMKVDGAVVSLKTIKARV